MASEVIGYGAARSAHQERLYAGHPSTIALDSLLTAAMVVLGMMPALDRFLPFTLGPLTVTFVLLISLATLGYWTGIHDPVMRRFVLWAAAFSAMAVISLAANGALVTLVSSAGILGWFLAIPGVASLCVDRRRFRALLHGLMIGAGVLLCVVVSRWLRGVRILDKDYQQLLGLNRNAIDLTIVWLVPTVLWSRTVGVPRFGRWLFVGAALIWLLSSEGRTGFIALLMVPFVYMLLKPSPNSSRTGRFMIVGALGLLMYSALTSVAIPGIPATERIAKFESTDRTSSDDIRSLLNQKSIALFRKHPVTGVGFGLYNGQYDPVVEKARTPHIRQQALKLPGHNTYYEVFATTGAFGGLMFVGLLALPLVAGIRRSDDPDVCALTTGYVIVLFCITFHTSFGSLLGPPLALVMAAVARAGPRRAQTGSGAPTM